MAKMNGKLRHAEHTAGDDGLKRTIWAVTLGLVAKEDWTPVISRFTLKQFQTLILALELKENAGDLNPRFFQPEKFQDFAHAHAVKSVGLIPKLQTCSNTVHCIHGSNAQLHIGVI